MMVALGVLVYLCCVSAYATISSLIVTAVLGVALTIFWAYIIFCQALCCHFVKRSQVSILRTSQTVAAGDGLLHLRNATNRTGYNFALRSCSGTTTRSPTSSTPTHISRAWTARLRGQKRGGCEVREERVREFGLLHLFKRLVAENIFSLSCKVGQFLRNLRVAAPCSRKPSGAGSTFGTFMDVRRW